MLAIAMQIEIHISYSASVCYSAPAHQQQFFIAAEFLDRGFTLTGAAAGVALLAVHDFQRLSAIEVPGAAGPALVFLETPFDIGGDTGVHRVIVATDDVNIPIHANRVRQLRGVCQ